MPLILLVDDNEESRDTLSRRLLRRGYSVVTASDGLSGIALARERQPDLVLMDLNMPDVDGWEAARRIREEAPADKMPVIALTAHAMTGDRQRALDAGCVDYHAKPIEFQKLLAQIESFIGKT